MIGDISQLARVPYTHHEKTGKLCRPIDLQSLPHYREHGVPFELCKKALYRVGRELAEKAKPRPREFRYRISRMNLRPCIETALSRGNPSHKMRQAIVAELHADGWGVGRIIDSFSGFVDFDRRITEYQVKHIIKGGYSPFKCSTIRDMGGCLGRKCPFFRRKNS